MKKIIFVIASLILLTGLVSCGSTDQSRGKKSTESSREEAKSGELKEEKNSVLAASEGAEIQREDPQMPTRVIKNGTKINMYFGDTVIPGILNDSKTAQALIDMLPYTVHMNRYSHDFCGVMDDPLPYAEKEVHDGWLNGDIDFATDADYFTILFEDEESSEQYGYQVNIGVIDCPLEKISELTGSYDVRIELAEE